MWYHDREDLDPTGLFVFLALVLMAMLVYSYYFTGDLPEGIRQSPLGVIRRRTSKEKIEAGPGETGTNETDKQCPPTREVGQCMHHKPSSERADGEEHASGEASKAPVKRVRSQKDNNLYYVGADLPDPQQAADIMAEMNRRTHILLESLNKHLRNGRIMSADNKDITEEINRIVSKHYGKRLPLAEYHVPNDLTVGSNSEKGKLIEICLRSKDDPKKWNSQNTLFRVLTHELAHSGDKEYRADGEKAHGPHFERIHTYILREAERLGLYSCQEYHDSGREFCALVLSDKFC